LRGWDPAAIYDACIASQRARLFIHQTTAGEPNWAYRHRADDGARFIRNAGAVEVKAKARFPYVAPTPFIKDAD